VWRQTHCEILAPVMCEHIWHTKKQLSWIILHVNNTSASKTSLVFFTC